MGFDLQDPTDRKVAPTPKGQTRQHMHHMRHWRREQREVKREERREKERKREREKERKRERGPASPSRQRQRQRLNAKRPEFQYNQLTEAPQNSVAVAERFQIVVAVILSSNIALTCEIVHRIESVHEPQRRLGMGSEAAAATGKQLVLWFPAKAVLARQYTEGCVSFLRLCRRSCPLRSKRLCSACSLRVILSGPGTWWCANVEKQESGP